MKKLIIFGIAIIILLGIFHYSNNKDQKINYKGFNIVEKTILRLWSAHIKKSVITQIDAKTKLQEFSLKKFKKLPLYKLVSNTGPRHKPLFKIGVKLTVTQFYYAEGRSKKDAEQNAAILC